jgi:hypothetical protein
MEAYQELVDTLGNLPLRACDGNLIASLLSAGEHDLAVPLLLKALDLVEARQELAVVKAVDVDDLRGKLGVLNRAVSAKSMIPGIECPMVSHMGSRHCNLPPDRPSPGSQT